MEVDAEETSTVGFKLAKDHTYAYNTLRFVFRYLAPFDLLCAAHVCTMWKWILEVDEFKISTMPLYACIKHAGEVAESFGSGVAGMTVVLQDLNPNNPFGPLRQAIKKIPCTLSKMYVLASGDRFFDILPVLVPEIKELRVWVFDKPRDDFIIMPFIAEFANLQLLDLQADSRDFPSFPTLRTCQKLRHLKLRLNSRWPSWKPLMSLGQLESLELAGHTANYWLLDREFWSDLANMHNMTSLVLPIWIGSKSYFGNLLHISNFTSLERLSFFGKPMYHRVVRELCDYLAQIKKVKHLSLALSPPEKCQTFLRNLNNVTFESVCNLTHLSSFTWIVQRLRETDTKGTLTPNNRPLNLDINTMSAEQIKREMSTKLPSTSVEIMDASCLASNAANMFREMDKTAKPRCFKCTLNIRNAFP